MATITNCLVLTGAAAEAAEFYAEVFGARVEARIPDGRGGVVLCTLRLCGQELVILNGADAAASVPSQRVTLQVHVDGQEEFDRYWFGLLAGGSAGRCGWLTDRFGVWWNIVPEQQRRILQRATRETMPRITRALAGMERIDLAELERIASAAA